MMKLKSTLFIVCALILTGNVFTQDVPDYVWKTPMTKVYPTGEYYNLPQAQDQVNYQNPNTTTRVVNTGEELLVLPPNVRPFPHTATQSEVDATTMKGNGSVMFASWNSYGPSFWGTGFCFSNNGGTSWSGNFQMYTPNSGDPGAIIWPTGSTWAGRLGLSCIQGFGHSTNNGTSWVFDMNFPGASSFDKNFSAVDDVSGSPFFGRAYTVWTNFGGTYVNRIVGSYSTDGGATWSAAQPVSPVPASGHHQQGCDVRVGPGGVVYVVWAHCTTNGQNSTEDHLGYAKSTDGGVTWPTATNTAVDVNGIRASNLFNGIRASGFPRLAIDMTGGARNGWLYAVLSEKTIAPATDVSDVTICISSNGGTSWTHSKVNQDNSGRYNYMPAICVTPDGGVNVSYYDQRNTSGFVTEFWMSRSLNGGSTWTDVAVSDHTFTPAPIPGLAGGYQGDYTGCTFSSGSGKIFPFWADNSSGIYQVWTVGITYGPPPANDVVVGPFLSFPSSFTVNQARTIRGKVTNGGTNGQTNLPVRFSVNGTIQTTNTIASLPSGAVDSSSFTWTPTVVGNYTLKIFSGAATDENRSNDTITQVVTVQPAGLVNSQTQICRNNVNLVIPDNSTVKDSIVVNIANAFNVVDVNVRIDTLNHTWDSDLSFTLSRGAASCNIISAVGGSGDNFRNTVLNDSATTPIASGTAPFTGTYIPSSPLSSLNGVPVNGSWVLTITDNATGDTGLLKAWCIQVTYQALVGGIQTIEIPNYFSLAQNYPNPFNPTTSIKYSVPTAVNVSLKVYDLLGKEVATLVNEMKQPGFHTADFNASNLASGIYFYRIDAGEFTSVKKMMLVK
ncbi:MAG TPA: T9SS type A sorting domain-containing protein [Ignavibacteria bacterium]|nr:T9SS type A sorting domain-containing protein [Ignavibacteria bacterium]